MKLKLIIVLLFVIITIILGISIPSNNLNIIYKVRIPRVILSFLVGGMLSVSGCIVQSVLKNPLASPYTLGVSSGASLGIGLLMVFSIKINYLFYPVVGFIFSIVTIFLVIGFSRILDRNLSNIIIILIGMVVSMFLNSVLILISSLNREGLMSILTWQMGGFSGRGYKYIFAVVPFLILSLIFIFKYIKELDILTFGDEMGKSIGVDIEKVKVKLLILACILTGASISVSGIIGFIDLIVPNIVRKLFFSKHSIVVPISFLLGGGFMVTFDMISRNIIYPSEVPLGVVTSIIGTIIFCYIFFMNNRRGKNA